VAQRQRKSDDAFRQARTALRLQKSVLPDDAVQLLANEVVVRLASRLHPELASQAAPVPVPIETFCAALLSDDSDAAMEMVRKERRDGVPLETVYIMTLAAACRHLGTLWEDDRLSFLQMSVAAGRVFEIMRSLRRQIALPLGLDLPERKALFATVPGEMHSIGVTMAADLFRNRGWEIDLRTGFDHEALLDSIAERPYRIIGLSAGHPSTIVALTRLIVALRITHPESQIIVSGNIANEVRGLNALIRADFVLHDNENVIELFERLATEK
jgi:MerR family transcriptional regulator, light-induced transcriptional regulator